MFGEGGVLFDRLRSATVEVQGGDDRGDLEAWVVSREVFMNEVLPTPELRRVFDEKAFDGKGGIRYIDMDTFVDIVSSTASDSDYIKVQNIYNILRKDEGKHFIGESRISAPWDRPNYIAIFAHKHATPLLYHRLCELLHLLRPDVPPGPAGRHRVHAYGQDVHRLHQPDGLQGLR
jgi:hypothetical protein